MIKPCFNLKVEFEETGFSNEREARIAWNFIKNLLDGAGYRGASALLTMDNVDYGGEHIVGETIVDELD